MPLNEDRKPNGYWNYERCYEEAKKYKTRAEFQRYNGAAYRVARVNGWLDDYNWFEDGIKTRTEKLRKWNYDTCYEEAKKYKSRAEFSRNNQRAYQVACKNGWLNDYTWFEKPFIWTYETCYEEAKKYKTRAEFQKNKPGAYTVALKNGWLDDYTWFEDGRKITNEKQRKWNRETCYNEAKKYNSKSEFKRNSGRAYQVAWKNGWLNDYTWLKERVLSDKSIYIVYYYEDKDTNAVYVGLTNNMKRRHRQHSKGMLKHGEIKYDIVYRYFHDTLGKEVPEPIILHKDIYAKEAQEYEKKYVEQFKNEGKLVLNIAKTGSLGGYGKWNKNTCYNEAKKYKSRNEFQINSGRAYRVALENGWLDEYTWFKKAPSHDSYKEKGYWNQETCYNEAKKYKTKAEFKKNAPTAYHVSRENGWLENYTWFDKLRGNWDYDSCYQEASKYKTKADFRRGNKGAYSYAYKHGWLDEYTWFLDEHQARKLSKTKWTRESCYNEAKKYNKITEFHKNSGGAFMAAYRNGWLSDYTWLQRPSKSNQAALG